MQTRRIKELEVSCLGLGTVKWGRNEGLKYPTPFSLPTDKEVKHLLTLAKSLGINLLDTAPAYGHSEERLGKLIEDRHQWIISTKAGEEFHNGVSHFDFSASAIIQSIERSLHRLKTDYIDILLIHSNGDDLKIIEEDEVFETLEKIRQAGKIRYFGMSSKTLEGGLATLKYADVAMVMYHPAYTLELPVIENAHALNKGILIKKAFNSGILPPQKAIEFGLKQPGISSIILGTQNPLHLQQNCQCINF